VKLLVLEDGTEALRAAAGGARAVVSSRIAYVEGRAFIGRAARERRLTAREASRVRALLSTLWTGLVIVELDDELGTIAGDVAERLQLRGMDAIHLASARVGAAGSRDERRADPIRDVGCSPRRRGGRTRTRDLSPSGRRPELGERSPQLRRDRLGLAGLVRPSDPHHRRAPDEESVTLPARHDVRVHVRHALADARIDRDQ